MVHGRANNCDSGTDYDNLSSSPNTDTEDLAPSSAEESSGESTRSASLTPTVSQESAESNCERLRDCTFKEVEISETPKKTSRNVKRGMRPYRIIDSDASQRLLQQVAAERMAAVHNAERQQPPRLLRRKPSAVTIGRLTNLHIQRHGSCSSQLWLSGGSESAKTSSSRRAHFDVTRTASFGGNSSRACVRRLSNRNSLPLGVVIPVLGESGECEVEEELSKQRMATAVEGRFSLTNANGKQLLDDDLESVQRLSFVSTSTGYSSARSSLRSSEIGDDSFLHSSDVTIERRLIARETLLSETRRQKLLKNGGASPLDRIAMEILETERCYVNDLNDIIQGYLNFFVDHREEFQMTVDDVSSTFGCIERIFLFNRRLFHQLDAALLNVVQMARCFVENIEGFNDYVTYCTNYQKMVDTLSHLMKNSAIVETLALRQSVLGHSLPLSAYLLKPVQRVLKYHLFMENILKQSAETRTLSDADRAAIKEALDCLTSQAEKINEEKKRVEHWERVRELQSALQRWCLDQSEDLSKYGDLLLEGTFKLAGSKTNRQLFLFEEMLLIVKERNGALNCKDYIMCSSLMLNESVSPDPLAFQVLSFDNPKIQYVFLAPSLDQKRQWMKELKRMMLDHYTVEIPERTKLLMLNMDNTAKSSLTPFDHEADVSSNVKSNRRIPKYLEKRRKSTDPAAARRSHRRHRSGSTSRLPVNPPSIVNGFSQRSKPDLTIVPKESLTCTCSYDAEPQPSTSNFSRKVGERKPPSLILSSSYEPESSTTSSAATSTSSFSNLFSRRKTSDPTKGSAKLIVAPVPRKRSGGMTPTLVVTADNDTAKVVNEPQFCSPQELEPVRCTCSDGESAKSSTPETSPSMCSRSPQPSSEQIENTFSELYKELHLFISNAEALDDVLGKESTDGERPTAVRQHAAANRLDALVSTPAANRERGGVRGVNKFDRMYSSVPLIDSPIVDRTESFVITAVDSDSEAFLNGSTVGRFADEEGQRHVTDSEDDEPPPSSMTWADVPTARERSLSHTSTPSIYHKRRSSQVAEQVWRLRQKQNNQKQNEGSTDGKLFSQYLMPPSLVTPREVGAEKAPLVSPSVSVEHSEERPERGQWNPPAMLFPRQRTPLTPEQCAQLDDVLLEPNLGVVKEMVKQLEKPGAPPARSSPLLLS